MKAHADFEGTPLKKGDKIIFIPYMGGGFVRGSVVGFTPKMIRCLEKDIDATRIYNYRGKAQVIPNHVNRYSYDVYKIKGL